MFVLFSSSPPDWNVSETFKIAFRGVEFQQKHRKFHIPQPIVCNSNLIFLIKMNPINQLQKEALPLLQQEA